MLNKFLNKIKNIFSKPKPYKQELLLIKALKEKGFDIRKLKIECDHLYGKNFVNGVEMGIKYPDSFFRKANSLVKSDRKYTFYFKGFVDENGGRNEMLKPFKDDAKSKIIYTNKGRSQILKDKFDNEYFTEFANSKFGLCPNQLNWPGPTEHVWTYRFIESCFVSAIPVVFTKTPLGKKFIEGFTVMKDTDFFDSKKPEYNILDAKNNLIQAKNKFLLNEKECIKIKETLKR